MKKTNGFCTLENGQMKHNNLKPIKSPPMQAGDFFVQEFICAQDWIRTSTSLRTLRPEHSASTNFATWAVGCKCKMPASPCQIYFNGAEERNY